MEQLVRVKETYEDGTALVSIARKSACSGDCHQCAGCGAVQETVLIRADNAIYASPGELVVITARSAPVLAGAAVMYLMPLAMFFAGYLMGMQLWETGALMGCLFFLAGITGAILYDRLIAKKQNNHYTITGYPDRKILEAHVKGDNDLD